MRTTLQTEADRQAENLRRKVADELRRLREDAGLSQSAIARVAGVHPSVVHRMEDHELLPTLETYVRICSALGADFAARPYPNTGPQIHDRHQTPMAELLIGSLHLRWLVNAEVAVRKPARGWVDTVLHEPRSETLVATELESDIRRIEQILRWGREKADSLPSANGWPTWAPASPPTISQLLVIRWTRANRDVAAAARRQLRSAYPADPADALESLTGTTAWPGAAILWARLDTTPPRLVIG